MLKGFIWYNIPFLVKPKVLPQFQLVVYPMVISPSFA
jgi:hypothetical protein